MKYDNYWQFLAPSGAYICSEDTGGHGLGNASGLLYATNLWIALLKRKRDFYSFHMLS